MNCSYLGGFFDGEGTVYSSNGKIRISIPQTDYEVLNQIKNFVGVGNIYQTKKQKEIHKDAWVYTITNWKGSLKFLLLIRDEVIVKKDIVSFYINYLNDISSKLNEETIIRENEKVEVKLLYDKGFSYRKIEKIIGFSRQKVCRLLKE